MNKNASNSISSKHKSQTSWFLYVFLFFIFLSICLLLASKVVVRNKGIPINYNEDGNISYKVYLNKNDFYTEEYLDMNKSYVASLINYIDIDFNYSFSINTLTTMDFNYKIIAELAIENSKGNTRYLEKEYTLLDTKVGKIIQDKSKNIKENIKINYAYYNQLANSFKSTYGVDTYSYLIVYLLVETKTNKDLNYNINENNKISLKIPLSEKAIEINLDASNNSIHRQIVPSLEVKFNIFYLIMELVFFIPTCYLMIKIINIISKVLDIYTPYDRYINKILKEYDRLIVETNSKLKINGYNIIKINSFMELLDARDNLNLPILYLNTIPHKEGMFYIISDNNLYMLLIQNDKVKK